ncbi:hypothetical protein [Burkholderia sp. S171]|uniref:hypothetical protein n=1 Tax=Burkholderia sp. S171 TaxID=1641860 RepID=UPI00131BD1C4|nr:hypothetical protein [Burkholderia sp. S171]
MASTIIRKAIVNAIFNWSDDIGLKLPQEAAAYATKRFGSTSEITKALVNPVGVGTLTDGHSALVNETLVRDEFVQAVFSGSILGKLQGLIEVPALTRIKREHDPKSCVLRHSCVTSRCWLIRNLQMLRRLISQLGETRD